ncbi:ATP-binding protein [Streptomyces sp. NPDC001985]|uniref:sensor histidine kinase n=1 Tax=Streptomyces sp. NPDC001985 TaxID=3154406 RepID=UPI00332DBA96
MDVNAAVAALAALAGLLTGVIAMLAFRWSEREQRRPTRTSLHTDAVLPPGVDTVLSVLRSSAVVLDEADSVVKASSAAYALGLVRGGKLTVEAMLQMARDTRRDGEIRQVELDLPRRGTGRGEALAVSARVAPLGSRLVLLLVEDLTEARRIEAVRRDFVANVSHELKTPVGALSLLSEAVMDASDDPEAVSRFAGRMQIEATRLTNLVQELIDLSRVQNDDPLEDAEPVRVDELVAEAIDRSRHPASTKQITMASGGTSGLFIWGNRGKLAAALGNLVENAVNYSPARTRVGISARRISPPGTAAQPGSGGFIEIAVTDQGIGISEKDRERVFERFYRVDPARSRATGGTGLGLAIVKHVAASHGGEVTVWSTEGQGSTFTLRLPEAGSARDRAASAPDDGPGDTGSPLPFDTAPDRGPEADAAPAPGPDPGPGPHPGENPHPGTDLHPGAAPRAGTGTAPPPGPSAPSPGPSAPPPGPSAPSPAPSVPPSGPSVPPSGFAGTAPRRPDRSPRGDGRPHDTDPHTDIPAPEVLP